MTTIPSSAAVGPVAAAPPASAVPERVRLVRFDRAERVLHWVNAALFGVLMATGAVLYVGPLSALVRRRSWTRLRRSASIPRWWTIPSSHERTLPRSGS